MGLGETIDRFLPFLLPIVTLRLTFSQKCMHLVHILVDINRLLSDICSKNSTEGTGLISFDIWNLEKYIDTL